MKFQQITARHHKEDIGIKELQTVSRVVSDHVIYPPQTAAGGNKTEGSNTIMSTSVL